VEDVRLLVSGGEDPDRVALRIGVQVGSISRAMYRAGELDLARIFGRSAKRHRARDRTGSRA